MSYYPYLGALLGINVGIFSLADLTALQTVAAGQVAENLLDFDDKPGGADGARGHPGVTAASSEEQHVRYIDKSTRRPCFDICVYHHRVRRLPRRRRLRLQSMRSVGLVGSCRRRRCPRQRRINKRISWSCSREENYFVVTKEWNVATSWIALSSHMSHRGMSICICEIGEATSSWVATILY